MAEKVWLKKFSALCATATKIKKIGDHRRIVNLMKYKRISIKYTIFFAEHLEKKPAVKATYITMGNWDPWRVL
jgi:hypothetical protein